MTIGVLTIPCVDIGGGQRERIEPVDFVAVGDPGIAVEIGPAGAFLLSGIARLAVG